MPGVYLYCIAPAGHRPPAGLRGLEDRPVRGLEAGPFCLWVSELEEAPRPTVERARRHNAVIEAASSEAVTPVPVRFGQWLASAEPLKARVERRRPGYEEALRTLAGALEFGVRIGDPAREQPDPRVAPTAASGRDYLHALARRAAGERAARARVEEIGAALRDALGPLVRQERIGSPPRGEAVASVAHLVRRVDGSAYRRRLDEFGREHPELRLRLTGPWPPYSFVP